MNAIKDIQDEIVAEFELFDDWQDKYAHIIDLGRELPALDEAHKTEANKVKGCQSQVWLHSALVDGLMVLEAESDALIVNGLVAILLRIYAHRPPREVASASNSFMERIGLDKHLSMNRTNGLHAMMTEIQRRAVNYQAELLN
jgi:cysteine desulfuration protein SufE